VAVVLARIHAPFQDGAADMSVNHALGG